MEEACTFQSWMTFRNCKKILTGWRKNQKRNRRKPEGDLMRTRIPVRKKIDETIKVQTGLDSSECDPHYFNGSWICEHGRANKLSGGSAWNNCFRIDCRGNYFLDPEKQGREKSYQKTLNRSKQFLSNFPCRWDVQYRSTLLHVGADFFQTNKQCHILSIRKNVAIRPTWRENIQRPLGNLPGLIQRYFQPPCPIRGRVFWNPLLHGY